MPKRKQQNKLLASVSVLGCGWLGFPLAVSLLKYGYLVRGSTTTLEKIPVLKEAGIFSFCLAVGDEVEGQGVAEFFTSDIVVITLPFRRNLRRVGSSEEPKDYQMQIDAIIRACEKSNQVKFVIFTSSTSVYPEQEGLAREDMAFVPENLRSEFLLNIEKNLLANKHFAATIVRLAGLYGGDRKIGRFLAGQKDVPDGQKVVNLIHQDDAVGILNGIIRKGLKGQIFNACSDVHPTREELYVKAAHSLGLPIPQFRQSGSALGKIVSNEKVKQMLGYQFLHPDPKSL